MSTSTRRLVRESQFGIRDVRGYTKDVQASTRRLVRGVEPAVQKKPQFENDLRVEEVSQDAFSQDDEKMDEINEKLGKLKIGSGTTFIRNDVSKGEMIFSEESSRAICEMGNMELIDLRQTSATIQCPSCLKHVPERFEHVSLRRLASTQSKYGGPNQNSICRVLNSLLPCLSNHFKRKEKWSQTMADGSSKSYGCKKRGTETRQIHLYTGPMAE